MSEGKKKVPVLDGSVAGVSRGQPGRGSAHSPWTNLRINPFSVSIGALKTKTRTMSRVICKILCACV